MINRKLKRMFKSKGARLQSAVRADYHRKCAELGELTYRIEQYTDARKELMKNIKDLNSEFVTAQPDPTPEKPSTEAASSEHGEEETHD